MSKCVLCNLIISMLCDSVSIKYRCQRYMNRKKNEIFFIQTIIKLKILLFSIAFLLNPKVFRSNKNRNAFNFHLSQGILLK